MSLSKDSDRRRIETFKLDGDLRDAYVELLSAQSAVDRLRLRYRPEEVAVGGSSFMVARSISAAQAICEYFSSIHKCLPAQAGVPPRGNGESDREPNL